MPTGHVTDSVVGVIESVGIPAIESVGIRVDVEDLVKKSPMVKRSARHGVTESLSDAKSRSRGREQRQPARKNGIKAKSELDQMAGL